MKMTFRWYGEGNDSVPLKHIKQIPGVDGVVWALHDFPVGETWPMERIMEVKKQVEPYGLNLDVVESVNIHEDIKLGLPSAERYIDNYIQTIRNLSKVGVKVICYNFMPVFDWTRTNLFKPLEDGSTALFYERAKVENVDPIAFMREVAKGGGQYTLPGWEPEKFARLESLFAQYKDISTEKLWKHLQHFLERVIPVAEECGIKMAIHPDDPPWPIFGLPRIITNRDNLLKFLKLVDNPANCLTLCSGSLGASTSNNIASIIREVGNRIAFAHIRNIKHYDNGDFVETSHRACDGSLDIVDIVKAYHDIGFTGYARPDHGRHIFDEQCRPGYGLYDRALGIMYIWGVWDSLERFDKK